MKVQRGREIVSVYPLRSKEVFNIQAGDEVYDEEGHKCKVTSVKKWVTRPNDLDIHWKHGLYDYGSIEIRDGKPRYPWEKGVFRSTRTQFKAPKGVKGLRFKVGQKVVLEEAHPDWQHNNIPVGMDGEIKNIREIPVEQADLNEGQRAFLEIKWKKGGTTYNTYPRQVKVKKPRLSR